MHTSGMTLSEENAPQLWRSLQLGEEKALHGLYHLYRDDLYSYAKRIILSDEAALNAIQELFLRLWNTRQTLGEAHSVKAYLLSTLRRLLMQEIRDRQKYTLWSGDYETQAGFSGFSPEDVVILDENTSLKKELVARLLNSLTDRQREIVYLRYYEDLSLPEIAEMLDINYQSVINHLQRAFLKVRSQTTPAQLAALLCATGLATAFSAFG
jgi:RNA polymerase sigma factor (sigma-70 family)